MARLTVVITPRDRFSGTAECIAALRARTPEPFDLLALDLGWPRRVRQEVARETARAGGEVVALGRMLPLEALRRARSRIRTPYTFLLDSDSRVEEGWLEPLLLAAADGAAVVAPLVLERDRPDRGSRLRVHFRVGELRVTAASGSRRLLEHLPEREASPSAVSRHRAPTDLFEMHGVLLETEVLCALDLPRMTAREHVDLAMQVRAMGRDLVSEPRSVVVFDNLSRRLTRADLRWFFFRWSGLEIEAAEALFERRWGWRFSTEDVLHDWTLRRKAYVVARHLRLPSHAAHRLARAVVRWRGRGADVRDGAPLAQSERLYERLPRGVPVCRDAVPAARPPLVVAHLAR